MTAFEASTTCLIHAEDLANAGSVKSLAAQNFPTEPVSTTTSVAKFGTRSIDLYTANYGGVRWPSSAPLIKDIAATMDGFVYIRSFRSSSRAIFGVFSGSASLTLSFGIWHDAIGRPYATYRDTGGNINNFSGSSALALNQWVHLALTVDETGLRRLFVDGTQVASSSSVSFGSLETLRAGAFGLGGVGNSGGSPVDGCADEVRYVFGHALNSGSSFTVPSSPYADSPSIDGASRIEPHRSKATGAFPAISKSLRRPHANLKDAHYGGRGFITDTVEEQGSPSNTPLRRRVRLIRDRDGTCVRETWSDAETGQYTFDNIDETQTYTVISYDHLRNYRAVVADNLTPELP